MTTAATATTATAAAARASSSSPAPALTASPLQRNTRVSSMRRHGSVCPKTAEAWHLLALFVVEQLERGYECERLLQTQLRRLALGVRGRSTPTPTTSDGEPTSETTTLADAPTTSSSSESGGGGDGSSSKPRDGRVSSAIANCTISFHDDESPLRVPSQIKVE